MGKIRAHKGDRRWKDSNEAVSEVVGSVLLVGLTVVVVSGFGLVATQAFSPIEKTHAELSPILAPGPNKVWGGATSDDRLELLHLGGAELQRAQTRIVVNTPSTATTFRDATLGPTFDAGFVIGETWTHASSFPTCTPVQVSVVIEHGRGGSQLLLQETLIANEGVCP